MKDIVILDGDPEVARVLETVLRSSGHRSLVAGDPSEALRALDEGDVGLILVDLELPDGAAEQTLRRLRAHPKGGPVQVLLSSSRHDRGDAPVKRLTRRYRVAGFQTRPFSMLDLPYEIGRLLEAAPAPETRRPTPEAPPASGSLEDKALRLIAEAWCRELSGTVEMQGGQTLLFSKGAPTRPDALERLERSMDRGEVLRFHVSTVEGYGDGDALGRRLWMRARALADRSYCERKRTMAPRPMPFAERLTYLPVPPWLPKLARRADGHTTLAALLESLGVAEAEASRDLGALAQLGLLRVRPAARRRHRPEEPPSSSTGARRRPQDSVDPQVVARSRSALEALQRARKADGAAGRRRRRRTQRDASEALLVLKRLRKELRLLRRADSWTALGIAPTEDLGHIDAALAKVKERYTPITRDPRFSEEVHALAQEVIDIAAAATERAKAITRGELIDADGNSVPPPEPQRDAPPPTHSAERYFEAGLDAMRRGDWRRAKKAFHAAHKKEIHSPRYMGYLGWATFKDSTRGPDRVDEALDLLELSDHFDRSDPEIQRFLAAVELHEGRLDRVEARLSRLRKHHPDHPGLGELRRGLARAQASKKG